MTIIDSRKLTDKAASHEYLMDVLKLPEYYGKNLDALHDCLTEMKREITVEHVDTAGEYYEAVREVLMDSAEENSNLRITELKGAARRCRLFRRNK